MQDQDGNINVNMEDDAIRGLTVVRTAASPGHRPHSNRPRHRRRKAAMPPPEGAWPRCRRTGVGNQGCGALRRRRAALLLMGIGAPPAFLSHFTVFVLACFVGYMVVWNVTPALHTPLMSVTNAISVDHLHRRAGADRAAAGGVSRPQALIQGLAAVSIALTTGQYVRRLRRHPPHARHVPQIETKETRHVCKSGNRLLHRSHHPSLSSALAAFPARKRRGAATSYGMIGMAIAVLATVFGPRDRRWLLAGSSAPWSSAVRSAFTPRAPSNDADA